MRAAMPALTIGATALLLALSGSAWCRPTSNVQSKATVIPLLPTNASGKLDSTECKVPFRFFVKPGKIYVIEMTDVQETLSPRLFVTQYCKELASTPKVGPRNANPVLVFVPPVHTWQKQLDAIFTPQVILPNLTFISPSGTQDRVFEAVAGLRKGHGEFKLTVHECHPVSKQAFAAIAEITHYYKDLKFDSPRDDVRGTPSVKVKHAMQQGSIYKIEMAAPTTTFGPYLRLESPAPKGRHLASSSYEAVYTQHAQIVHFCTSDGDHSILASSSAGETGNIKLNIHATQVVPFSICEEEALILADELVPQDIKDGVLKSSPCKEFWFEFEKDNSYAISLYAQRARFGKEIYSTFDAVLRLEDAKGRELKFSDDYVFCVEPGSSTDSRIRFDCKSNGFYKVIATSLDLYYDNTAGDTPDFQTGFGAFALVVELEPTKKH
jgi:hypothetical protein